VVGQLEPTKAERILDEVITAFFQEWLTAFENT
jgi:hypothetical protein